MNDYKVDARGPRLERMVVVSLLIHLVLVSVLLISPKFPKKRIFYAPVMSVSLISELPGGAVAAAKPETQPLPSPAKTVKRVTPPPKVEKKVASLKPQPAETKAPAPKEPEKKVPVLSPKESEPIEAKPREEPKVEPKPMVESQEFRRAPGVEEIRFRRQYQEALARLKERLKEREAPPKVAAPVRKEEESKELVLAPGGGPGQTQGGPLRGDLFDLKFKIYFNAVRELVSAAWIVPEGVSLKPSPTTIIMVRIGRDGTVTESWLEEKSGNFRFDDSAVRAIAKASQKRRARDAGSGFPPLPEEFKEEYMILGFRFRPEGVE